MTQTPAGWFPDPQQPGQMRYWDGEQWTEQRAPAVAPQVQYVQQPKSNTLRNVLLVVLGVFVLGFAGCVAIVGLGASEVAKEIDKQADEDKQPGGPDNPLELTPGQAFNVYGFDYAPGWKFQESAIGFEVKGLRFTNNRDETDSVLAEIRFTRGTELLVEMSCSSDEAEVGQTVTVDCYGEGDVPKNYDKVTIQDTF